MPSEKGNVAFAEILAVELLEIGTEIRRLNATLNCSPASKAQDRSGSLPGIGRVQGRCEGERRGSGGLVSGKGGIETSPDYPFEVIFCGSTLARTMLESANNTVLPNQTK